MTQSTTWSKLETGIFNIHYGNYGGLGIRIAYAVFALASGVRPLTGYLAWWLKRRSRR